MRCIGVGVIGFGYWGPNLARNLAELADASLVADRDANRRALAARRHPGTEIIDDAKALIAHPSVDAVVIATPVSSHFDLAASALKAGKQVLVEKPICATGEEALRLIEMAELHNLVLMVDHTFPYTGSVRKVKELVNSGHLGDRARCAA